MSTSQTVACEVVYALADRQIVVKLALPAGSTALDAIRASGIPELAPDGAAPAIGIFGKVVRADQVLRAGDRVEVYRPLQVDPRSARRERARRRR